MSDEISQLGILDIVCWYLNHHEGEEVSTKQIVEDTGLDMEDVSRSTCALRRLQNIAPDISEVDRSTELSVDEKASAATDLFSHDTLYVANYLLTLGRVEQDVNQEIDLTDHAALTGYDEAIEKMESYGWLVRDGDAIRLTTEGVITIGSEQAKATYGYNPCNP